MQLVLIFIGAGVGGLIRHLMGRTVHHWSGVHHVPIGTFIVNVLGCFSIGILAAAFAGPWQARDDIKLGLMVGLLGGFTTFSTFGRETIELFHAGRPGTAVAYILLSNGVAISSTWLGYVLARRVWA
ncbi:MAG TPA: fluoride efflux transporter CrcB [Tepidisphaeraceae bacterium]|nr:fluoride efflux transporter CrcB [Tepidisphaeraceae bacterium]